MSAITSEWLDVMERISHIGPSTMDEWSLREQEVIRDLRNIGLVTVWKVRLTPEGVYELEEARALQRDATPVAAPKTQQSASEEIKLTDAQLEALQKFADGTAQYEEKWPRNSLNHVLWNLGLIAENDDDNNYIVTPKGYQVLNKRNIKLTSKPAHKPEINPYDDTKTAQRERRRDFLNSLIDQLDDEKLASLASYAFNLIMEF